TLTSSLYSSAVAVTFEAVADEDGVVTVAWLTGSGSTQTLNWGEFSPSTGTFSTINSTSTVLGAPTRLSLTSHRELNGLAATPNRGYTIESSQIIGGMPVVTQTSNWLEGATAKTVGTGTGALVTVPPGCKDPAGDPVGYVETTGLYRRPGAT